jgi:hypothetical protein
MVGDDRVRFCEHCAKNVYNLSAMPRQEAEGLLFAKEGKVCVRLYKRADGTVLTNDCPVGVRRRRRRRIAALAVGSGLAAAAAMSARGLCAMGSHNLPHVMGEVPVSQQQARSPAAPERADSLPPVMGGAMGVVASPVPPDDAQHRNRRGTRP